MWYVNSTMCVCVYRNFVLCWVGRVCVRVQNVKIWIFKQNGIYTLVFSIVYFRDA
jgi:hypothetical protein